MKLLLVGEQNTKSDDPRFALYPLPPHCAGGRLCRILRMTERDYLRLFDRVNLLPPGPWRVRAAREQANQLRLLYNGRQMVLLGARVCAAFGVPFAPFEASPLAMTLVLPHPSGRCRIWNDPKSAGRARAALMAFHAPPAQLVG